MQFTVDDRHEDDTTFLWEAPVERATFYFPESYARSACTIAASLVEREGVDCNDVIDFAQRTSYRAPSAYALRSMPSGGDSPLFGTSIRGDWEVDIIETLAQLNGPRGDDCYSFTDPSRDECLPQRCLDPCFDTLEFRGPSTDPLLPARCDCYDQASLLITGDPSCDGLPEELTWRLDGPDVAPDCAELVAPTSSCAPYIDSAGFRPFGNQTCCTPAGRLRSDRDEAVCDDQGSTIDADCISLAECRETCGPACKAFKGALLGFEFQHEVHAG